MGHFLLELVQADVAYLGELALEGPCDEVLLLVEQFLGAGEALEAGDVQPLVVVGVGAVSYLLLYEVADVGVGSRREQGVPVL